MSYQLSISDNDICSTCKFCAYNPGKESSCALDWPTEPDIDGEIRDCPEYKKIDHPEQNWILS